MDITPPSSQVRTRHQLASVISQFGHTTVLTAALIFGRISNLTASAIRFFYTLTTISSAAHLLLFHIATFVSPPQQSHGHEQAHSHHAPSLSVPQFTYRYSSEARLDSPASWSCYAACLDCCSVVRVRGRGSADIASRAAWNPSISQPSFGSIAGCF
ncbi:hypothetical protein CGRA01v4_07506 [Colletotrichum graminicola]|nr:hypothetical protein CGRA01v4_07506 [Colletotrichum graminicola]